MEVGKKTTKKICKVFFFLDGWRLRLGSSLQLPAIQQPAAEAKIYAKYILSSSTASEYEKYEVKCICAMNAFVWGSEVEFLPARCLTACAPVRPFVRRQTWAGVNVYSGGFWCVRACECMCVFACLPVCLLTCVCV